MYGLLIIASWLAAASTAAVDEVVVIADAPLRVGEEVLATVPRGAILPVLASQDGWLWVDHAPRGWIARSQSVPLAEAEAHFTQAIQRDPEDAVALHTRANLRLRREAYDEAASGYSAVLRLHPDASRIYNSRGAAYSGLGDPQRAIAAFSRAIELDPDYAHAYYNRGRAYYEQQQYDRAIDNFSTAIRLDPQQAWAYNNRGLAYYAQGDYARAITDYNAALRVDPALNEVRNNRGWAYYKQGDREQSLADFREIARREAAPSAPRVEVGPLPTRGEP